MASASEKALHAALKRRVFDPVYYFHGDDDYLKDASIRDVIAAVIDPSTRDFNLEQRRASELDAEALDSLLGTPPMLADRRVAVIRDVEKLKKDARAFLDRYLTRPASDMVLLLVTPSGVKADRSLGERSTVVDFPPLTGDRVPKWVVHHVTTTLGCSITPEAVSLLVEAVGDDLAQLAVELEKLVSFSDGTIHEAAVVDLVGVRKGETLGALMDAVAARDAATAVALIPGVLQQPKTSAVSIVMALTTQTLVMASGQAALARGVSPRALFNQYMTLLKESGGFWARPWGDAISAWTNYTDRWTGAELDAALVALLTTDEALKETKLSSDEQMLTSLVLALCGTKASLRAA